MSTRTTELFTTVRTEGGLLPPSLLARAATADSSLPGLSPEAYHLAPGERLAEAINRSWSRLVGAWAGFSDALATRPADDPAQALTWDRWLLILFSELGYGRLQRAGGITVDDRSYAISHAWGTVPIHLVGAHVDLDRRTRGVAGAAHTSPHALVQDLLNRSDERLWGFLSNGIRLRLLRDNLALTRQSYVEFDLQAMMIGEVYSDFVVLWLLAHQSRVEAPTPEQYWLERWSIEARTQGSRALEHLREGVESAINELGSGFLSHRDNTALREGLRTGAVRPVDYYRQLLRVVYRLLFLLVAEERDLLLVPDASAEVRTRYAQYYSVSRIRRLAERRRGTRHTDLWMQTQFVIAAVRETGQPALGLPALGSELFAATGTADLESSQLSNASLLAAVRALSGRDDDRAGYRWLFDYRNLGVEELGSVYESLLELHPDVDVDARAFALTTGGSERHATGSHYTPPTILKQVLDFAVEPVIARALRAADPERALLDLRILDPAVGSGHFLISVAHRLARAVASVRTGEEEATPEHVRHALRDVVARCLYGVDLNPMAVELCRVALWLETLEPGKPLSFLDHHIRAGNSLLGVPSGTTVARGRQAVEDRHKELEGRRADLHRSREELGWANPAVIPIEKELREVTRGLRECVYDSWADAVPDVAFKPVGADDKTVARRWARDNKQRRLTNQMQLMSHVLVEMPDDLVALFDRLGAGAEDSLAEVTIRAREFDGAQRRAEYQHLVELANAWTSAFFWPLTEEAPDPPFQGAFLTLQDHPGSLPAGTAALCAQIAQERSLFHYELAFPEVFTADRGGFDLVIGNPPYLGGMKISGNYGDKVLHFLKSNHTAHTGGREDLAAYFLRRGFDLLRPQGHLCLITTNSIGEGDTRDAGLAPIVRSWGGALVNAIRSVPWTGAANVSVSVVHVYVGDWSGQRTLDGKVVPAITPSLTSGEDETAQPLADNLRLAVKGTNLVGDGFILNGDERQRLLTEDPRNAAVVKAFLGARDVLNSPTLSAGRWVIDFADRTLEDAAEFPACLDIVRQRVKPTRDRSKRKAYRERWWRFGERSANLYATIEGEGLDQVLVIPETSKVALPMRVATRGVVFFQSLFVVPDDTDVMYGLLTSSVHRVWISREATTHETRVRYNTDPCFVTFPRPTQAAEVGTFMAELDATRRSIMAERGLGLTALYNAIDDPDAGAVDVLELRSLHASLDRAVVAAYGWHDLTDRLQHGHHLVPKFGVRWGLSPAAQRVIETRLLKLNRELAAQQG